MKSSYAVIRLVNDTVLVGMVHPQAMNDMGITIFLPRKLNRYTDPELVSVEDWVVYSTDNHVNLSHEHIMTINSATDWLIEIYNDFGETDLQDIDDLIDEIMADQEIDGEEPSATPPPSFH